MDEPSGEEELWRAMLTGENSPLERSRRWHRYLPSSPRCKVCDAPFHGPGGVIMRLQGRAPARMNPRMCSACENFASSHPGGAEIDLSMLFADVRGSTGLAERLGTTAFTRLIGRFYSAVTDVLIKEDALIDRLIGDEVVALFIPALNGSEHPQAAVRAAEKILHATGHDEPGGPWVPVGAGVHTGVAFVGSVGTAGVTDLTVLGDEANLTARLASTAGAGEILISEATRTAAGLETTGMELQRLTVKGRQQPVDVWKRRVGAVERIADSATT